MIPAFFKIQSRKQETHDTFTIEIAPEMGQAFPFLPGQFSMLYVFGKGEVPISHSGPPGNGRHIHTIRKTGSVTGCISALGPGDRLGVRGPFGSNWPLEQARGRHLVIIAGGIGLAPLRPAIAQALQEKDNFSGLHLFYGARTSQDLLFLNEFRAWESGGWQIHVTVDRSSKDWMGHVGLVTSLFKYGDFEPANAVALICGPEIMMKFSARELQARGCPSSQIFLSMERNMQCATAHCGHCQYGPHFICKDGPVFAYEQIARLLSIKEL